MKRRYHTDRRSESRRLTPGICETIGFHTEHNRHTPHPTIYHHNRLKRAQSCWSSEGITFFASASVGTVIRARIARGISVRRSMRQRERETSCSFVSGKEERRDRKGRNYKYNTISRRNPWSGQITSFCGLNEGEAKQSRLKKLSNFVNLDELSPRIWCKSGADRTTPPAEG